jgi:hypothetical protein
MGLQDRAWDTKLAKAAWLLELADRWNERDAEFADQLRIKAQEIGAEDSRPVGSISYKT